MGRTIDAGVMGRTIDAGGAEFGLSLGDELQVTPIDGGIPFTEAGVTNPERDEADGDDDADGNKGGGAPIDGAEGAIVGAEGPIVGADGGGRGGGGFKSRLWSLITFA